MPVTIHLPNVLIETARNSTTGWVKELCYQTIIRDGLLDAASLQNVFDVFMSGSPSITAEPTIEGDNEPLYLCGLKHISGVNRLKDYADIKFCDEGITLLYGTNGSGKSGFFRILNHLSGKPLAKQVLPDIYANETKPFACEISYKLGDENVARFLWDNTDATKGIKPFNRISVFDSNYAQYYVQEHDPDTYVLYSQGYFLIDLLKGNLDMLMQKVQYESPERIEEVMSEPLADIDLTALYTNYVTALKIQLEEEVNHLIMKDLKVDVNHHISPDGRPVLTLKLRRPYPITEVLSEGELKSLALGLFIAEQKLKNIKSVIVLDDPVNSLDNYIIERFAERLIDLDNQVILFTHNMRLMDFIYKSRKVSSYSPSTSKSARTDRKKHVVAYQLQSRGYAKGVPLHYGEKMASIFLQWANEDLRNAENDDGFTIKAADNLRHAVEYLVDEKVFMGLTPCKYRGKYDVIPWEKLHFLRNVTADTIECLKQQYCRLSNGNAHLGEHSIDCPLEYDDLLQIYDALKAL